MKEYQITTEKDKKNNTLHLTLQGKLNISQIKAIEEDFKKATKDCKKCNIELSNIDDADLSIIQLLKAFEISCKKNKVEVAFSINLNENSTQLLTKSGLNNIFNK